MWRKQKAFGKEKIMKKQYSAPKMETILLAEDDLIRTSLGQWGEKETKDDLPWDEEEE